MLRQLGIVVAAAAFCVIAPMLPATAEEGTTAPGVYPTADISAQKVKRARKPSGRPIAAAPVAAPGAYYQQCFLFFCSSERPYRWLVLGVGY